MPYCNHCKKDWKAEGWLSCVTCTVKSVRAAERARWENACKVALEMAEGIDAAPERIAAYAAINSLRTYYAEQRKPEGDDGKD